MSPVCRPGEARCLNIKELSYSGLRSPLSVVGTDTGTMTAVPAAFPSPAGLFPAPFFPWKSPWNGLAAEGVTGAP